MTNKEIVLNDIFEQHKLQVQDINSYLYIERDNHCLFYVPYLVRYENEVYLQSWDYYINEDKRVLSTGVHYWGEGEPAGIDESVYLKSDKDEDHLSYVLEIIKSESKYFKEDIFSRTKQEILRLYSLEIVIQSNNYRVRVRSIFTHAIAYDFFYNQAIKEFKLNQFNPNYNLN